MQDYVKILFYTEVGLDDIYAFDSLNANVKRISCHKTVLYCFKVYTRTSDIRV